MMDGCDKAPPRPRHKGRSTNGQHRDVALNLLAVAQEQLGLRSHSEITSRELAALAGANQAMISYYFDCKDGLFSTLVEHALQANHRDLVQFERRIDRQKGCLVRALVELLNRNLLTSAALYRMLCAELGTNSSLIRQRYLRRGMKTHDMVTRIVSRFVDIGIFRPDTDVTRAVFTLVCFTSTPITLSPVIDLFGLRMEEFQRDEWNSHVASTMIRCFGMPETGCD